MSLERLEVVTPNESRRPSLRNKRDKIVLVPIYLLKISRRIAHQTECEKANSPTFDDEQIENCHSSRPVGAIGRAIDAASHWAAFIQQLHSAPA